MDSVQKNLDLGIICSAMVIVAMSAFADAVQLMCSIYRAKSVEDAALFKRNLS
jgi:hypothetical protein